MMKDTKWEVWDFAKDFCYDGSVSAPYLREECNSREEADRVYDHYQTTAGGDHRIIKVTRKQVRG